MSTHDPTQRPAPAAFVVRGQDRDPAPGPSPESAGAAGPEASPGADRAPADTPTATERALLMESKGPRVQLDRFEGPLDLLLFLIREEEVDITDIPIARITDQYLATIGNLDDLDLENAGEFLVMAASLMRIKAKMLLPRDPDEEDEDEDDPRAELVRRLLEYREFQQVSEKLSGRQEEWRGIFARATAPVPERDDEEEFPDPGVSLIDLFRSFRAILAQVEAESPLHMETESYSVDEQMDLIRTRCFRSGEGVTFLSLFEGIRSRSLMITTFLALLEIVRQREIVARQVERFGEIWLQRATEDAAAHE